MLSKDNNLNAFFELVRAGLWEKEARLLSFGEVDYEEIMRLAEEQSVVGLVTAGLEHVQDVKVPQELLLQFVGQTLQLEQQNTAMNSFIASLIEKMRNEDIYTILVKGQGIAQYYEKPLWRACGDVDLLLSDSNYDKTKEWFQQNGQLCIEENSYRKRVEYDIDGFKVELHGTMRGELGKRIDNVIDEVQRDIFYNGNVRFCTFGNSIVFLPSSDSDVIITFTHILQHFFRGGIGLRQICDWCRLLWKSRGSLDLRMLETRIRKAGLMSEWLAFGALSVDYLGMPQDAMPMYSTNPKWRRKSKKIMDYVLKMGNFGHNRDFSYLTKHTVLVRKIISFSRQTKQSSYLVSIFPVDVIKIVCSLFIRGIVQFVYEAKG